MANRISNNYSYNIHFYDEEEEVEDLYTEFNYCLKSCYDFSEHCDQVCDTIRCETTILTHMQVLSW
jgi:hypothetical protein